MSTGDDVPTRSRSEPARLLAVRSEHGYTDDPMKAMRDEGEAVSRDEQRAITQRAHVEAALRRRAAWNDARRRITEAVTDFATSFGDRRLDSPLRQVERAAEVVAERIAAL